MAESENPGLWKYTEEFLIAIRYPDQVERIKFSWKEFFLTLNGSAILIIPVALLLKFVLAFQNLGFTNQLTRIFLSDTHFSLIIFILLLGPLLEETCFRLPLVPKKHYTLAAFISSFAFILVIGLLRGHFPFHFLAFPFFYFFVKLSLSVRKFSFGD